jgi:hypothetical protein
MGRGVIMATYQYGTLASFDGRIYDANSRSLPAAAKTMSTTLNGLMEFDQVIRVHAGGLITIAHDHAPELHDGELDQLPDGDWSLFTHGYSGQYSYSGPIMHQSEYIGGALARDILETPGLYVALVDYPLDDSEPEGWAIATIPEE